MVTAITVERHALADEGSIETTEVSEAPGAYAFPGPAGRAGQVLIGVERILPLVSYTRRSQTVDSSTVTFGPGPHAPASSAHEVPRLALDVAIARGLTLGGTVFFAYEQRTGLSTVGASPRIGVAIRTSSKVTFFPKVGVSVAHSWAASANADQLALDVTAPFVFTVVEHAAVTLGPSLSIPVAGVSSPFGVTDLNAFHVGLYLGLLGWL